MLITKVDVIFKFEIRLGKSQDIHSTSVTESVREIRLPRIIDDDDADDETLDTERDSWNKYLAEKKIFWEKLYDMDVASREEEEEEEEEEILVELEKNPALHKLLQDMEERLEKKMYEKFVKIKKKVSSLRQKLRTVRHTVKDLQTEVIALKPQAWNQGEDNDWPEHQSEIWSQSEKSREKGKETETATKEKEKEQKLEKKKMEKKKLIQKEKKEKLRKRNKVKKRQREKEGAMTEKEGGEEDTTEMETKAKRQEETERERWDSDRERRKM